MPDDARITPNLLLKETRITADSHRETDAGICLNNRPAEDERKPTRLHRLEGGHSPWFYTSLVLGISNCILLLLLSADNKEALVQNDKVFRENQMEFEKEFKRRQAEIDKMQEVLNNNQKVIDDNQKEIDNRQKEIDKMQAEVDRLIREAQRGK